MYFLGLLLIVAILFWYRKSRRQTLHPLPPMLPGALPIIGNAHQLIANNDTHIPNQSHCYTLGMVLDGNEFKSIFPTSHTVTRWETIIKKSQLVTLLDDLSNFIENATNCCIKNGGVIHGRLGFEIYYAITDPEDAATVTNTCLQKHFAYDPLAAWLGTGLITRSGDTWKPYRKLMNPAFSLPVVHNFLGLFNSQSKKMVEKIQPQDGKEPFDMMSVLGNIVMETSCMSACGTAFVKGVEFTKMSKSVSELADLMIARFLKIWLHSNFIYKFLGYKKRENDLLEIVHQSTIQEIRNVKECKMNTNYSAESNGFTSFMNIFLDSPGIGNLSEKELVYELQTVMAVSYDTTWSALIYTLLIIGSYPEVQQKVYQEIIDVVGKDKDIDKDDVNKLVYTDAVVRESLRLKPPVPVVLRHVDKDVKLKNYTLRAGSSLIIFIGGINQHGWDDGKLFKPERWLQTSLPANTFASFGIGKRNCIGRAYAMVSMKVTIAHLVRAYELTADFSKVVNKMEVTMKPISGHEMSIKRRI